MDAGKVIVKYPRNILKFAHLRSFIITELKAGIVYSCAMRKWLPFILFALLLPLLWLNVKNSHDWGDDFAQYIIQARNIVEGKAQTNNALIFDEEAGQFAVTAYPAGFPLLLSPVVAVYGIAIKPLLLLESVFLLILGLLSFHFFRKYFSDLPAFIFTLFLCYHSLTLELKGQILSEIPFTALLTAIFLIIRSGMFNSKKYLLIGFMIAFLASVRIVGLLIIPALAIFLLQGFLKKDANPLSQNFNRLNFFIRTTISSSLLFIIFNSLLFDIHLDDFFNFYLNAGQAHETKFIENLFSYYEQLAYVFKIPFLNHSLVSFLCCGLVLAGMVQSFRKNAGPEHWFLLLYLLMLGLYPYNSGGFRFLFPIFPPLILFFFEGIRFFIQKTTPYVQSSVLIFACLLLFYSQYYPLKQILKQSSGITMGPQDKASQELFSFIRNNTPTDAVVAFPRARAMSLYVNRAATYLIKSNSTEENAQLVERLNVSHLIVSKGNETNPLYDDALLNYISYDRDKLQPAWENEDYIIYRRSD